MYTTIMYTTDINNILFCIPEAFVDASAQYVLSELRIPGMDGFGFDPNADNNFERDDL